MSQSSRRKFIQDTLKSLGLLGLSSAFSNTIIQAIVSSAEAQTTQCSTTDYTRYVYLSLNNGPPRWMLDQLLTPLGKTNTNFVQGGFGNALRNENGITNVTYETVNRANENLYLPPVWASNPNSADGFFNKCLQNAVFIRGVDMEIDNHTVSRYRNQAPALGGYSIAGILSGSYPCAQMTFPTITIGDMDAPFRSHKSVSSVAVNVGLANPVSQALSYFNKDRQPITTEPVLNALTQFDLYAQNSGIPNAGLGDAKNRADALIKKGVDAFINAWTMTQKKYDDLIKLAMTEAATVKFLIGDTLPVPASDTDVKKIYQPGTFLKNVTDFRQLVQSDTRVDNLAKTFAVMEILMTMEDAGILTNSLTASLAGQITNLHVNGPTAAGVSVTNDQHDVSSAVSAVMTNYYYRSLLCCLEEFIGVLGSRMSKTVIHINSEFNRIPRKDHSGSDHGVSGSSTLILSGITSISGIGPTGIGNGPVVVGNIYVNSDNRGTWGVAAPTIGTKKIRMDDVAVTVMQLLGLNSGYVSQNGTPLFNLIASKEAKNV